MLRIRPGRAWKHNPSYLGELRTLTAPAARAFTGAGLSDALGIEVDGVDIAAGAGEAPIVPAVEELCEALLRIGAGTPAAQATVGVGPTELLLEPRGPEVKLTLVALRRPGRVLVTDVLVDTLRLRKAARAAAHGLLLDLLEVCPALEGAPLARRLLRLCANLTKRPSRAAPAWPKVAEGQRASALSVRAGKPSLRGEVRLSPDACARLTGTSLVPQAPLLPLLGAGTVSLKLPAGPSLQIEGAPFLILRDLLAEGHDLLRALERHEPMQVLRFGKSELSFDPTRAALRVTGLTEAIELKPETLVGALGAMTMRYCAQALKLAGAHAQVTELRETAKELVELARALGSGELQRSNETVRSPPAKKERRAAPKRARGQLRRVLYRQTVQARVGPLLPGGLQLAPEPQGEGGRVIVSGPMGVVALDLITGEPRWSFGEGRGPWMLSRVPGGEDLLAAGGELLTRLDPQTGTARWKRRLSSPVQRASPLGGSTALALRDGQLVLVSDLGTLTLKTNPGASAESALLIDGILVVGLAGGTLTAFAARGGAPLWKRKLGTRTGDPLAAFGHLCVLCEEPEQAFLCALDPESGEVLYKKPLPPTRAQAELLLAGDQLVVPGGAGLHLIRARDGERRATLPLPGGAPSRILLSDDLEADAPTLLIRGAAGDLSRRTLDGRALWQRPATEDGPGPLVLAPGVALEGLHAFETTTGRALATLPGPRPDASALLADLTVALHDDMGTLSVHRAAGHLSLV